MANRRSREALELANSDEFKQIIDTDEINISELTKLLADSRLPDRADGCAFAWESYVWIMKSAESATVSSTAAMMELLEQRGLAEATED